MARLPRLVLPKQPHHVIQRGNDRQLIFREPEDYQRFLAWLKESAKEFKVAIHAYALMPNHLHLLATPSDHAGLAQTMQRVGRFYVPWFNHKYARYGDCSRGASGPRWSIRHPISWRAAAISSSTRCAPASPPGRSTIPGPAMPTTPGSGPIP